MSLPGVPGRLGRVPEAGYANAVNLSTKNMITGVGAMHLPSVGVISATDDASHRPYYCQPDGQTVGTRRQRIRNQGLFLLRSFRRRWKVAELSNWDGLARRPNAKECDASPPDQTAC